jgi:hypothetical protein
MWLMTLSKFDRAHDIRTFKCHVCEYTESKIVSFKDDIL